MKLTNDIAALLRRLDADGGATLTLSYDTTKGRYSAHTPKVGGASKRLDDALENLAEELRRRANAMDSVREFDSEETTQPSAAGLSGLLNVWYARNIP